MEREFATDSVIEWAWTVGRSDIRAWRNGYPLYQRCGIYEVFADELGERAAKSLYETNEASSPDR